MQLTAILLLSACLTVSATGHSQTVTLNLKDVPIQKVFREVIRQTGTSIIYNEAFFKNASSVTIKVNDAGVQEVLSECLKGLPFTFDLEGNAIVIKKRSAIFKDDEAVVEEPNLIDVHGKVVNERGEPVAGVTVTVKGTYNAAATDAEGFFQLSNVDEDGVLVFSGVNVEGREIKIGGKSDLGNVGLKMRVVTGEEVVVNTGYQQLPKERATGSFTQVDNATFNQQISTDVLSRLPAIANGLMVDKGTNGNGQIMIRGLSTIRGPKDPLIVVDNFPYDGDLNNINPNDVENITILKDAAAASIWGARAGNGVIVITTKKAHFNQPLSVSFNSNITLGLKPDLSYIRQISSSDFIDVEQFLYSKGYYKNQITSSAKTALSPVVELLIKKDDETISAADADAQINALRNYDVRDQYNRYMYQNALNQQYSLGLRGGTEKMNWITSAGYDRDISNLAASYNRLNFGYQNTFKPIKQLQLTSGIYYTQIKSTSGKNGYGGITSKGPYFFPYAQFADANGNAIPLVKDYRQSYIQTVGDGKLLDWQYYPLDDYKHTIGTTDINDMIANIGLNYKIINGLDIDFKYQYERQHTSINNLQDEQSYYARNYINQYSQINTDGTVTYNVPKGSILDYSNSLLQSHNFRGQLNYSKLWNKHEISAIAGTEVRNARTTAIQDRIYGYDGNNLTFGNVNYTVQYPNYITGSSSFIQDNRYVGNQSTRYLSFYANGAYTYNSKYTLSLSGRRDASNLFGLNTNDQWNPFWSAGISWNVSKELFYKSSVVPYLRLRATYGFSGNINPSMVAVTTVAYLGGPSFFTNMPYLRFSNYFNPDLKWETSKMLNIGADFKFLKNILTGSIEYYKKTGTNLFGTSPLDYTSGVGATIVKNVASMQGHGLDVEIKSLNLNKVIKWTSTLNFSYYKDKVTDYNLSSLNGKRFLSTQGVFPISGLKGYPVYSVFAYKWAGLDPTTGDPQGYLNGQVSKDYSSLTGSATQITDLKYFGSAIPTMFGSFINSISYKRLSLDFDIIYKFGYYFRRTSINYSNLFSSWQGNSDYADRWQKPGDELITNVPSLVYPASSARDNFYSGSEVLVDKGDHIRLQYITMSYDLNKHLFFQLPFKALRVYVNINNIGILWRANKDHIDPDYNFGSYPLINPKTFALGIRANF